MIDTLALLLFKDNAKLKATMNKTQVCRKCGKKVKDDYDNMVLLATGMLFCRACGAKYRKCVRKNKSCYLFTVEN